MHYFIQCMRCDCTTIRDIIATLDAFRLISELVALVLSSPVISIKYAGWGLIPHMRDRLCALDGRIAMENAWHPCLERENDDSIMENFAACTRITALELIRANEARLWLRVICISDLADINDRNIPWERLNRE